MDNQLNVGKNIRYLRERKNLTQTELAEMVGTTVNAISTYERAKHAPKLSTIRTIAEALDTTLAEIVSRDIEEDDNRKKYGSIAEEQATAYSPSNGNYIPLSQTQAYLKGQNHNLKSFYLPYISGNRYQIFDLASEMMHPTIAKGDRVLVEQIEMSSIRGGTICVLITEIDGLITKRVSVSGDMATLSSDNPSYEDYTIPISEIKEIWKVREIFRVVN